MVWRQCGSRHRRSQHRPPVSSSASRAFRLGSRRGDHRLGSLRARHRCGGRFLLHGSTCPWPAQRRKRSRRDLPGRSAWRPLPVLPVFRHCRATRTGGFREAGSRRAAGKSRGDGKVPRGGGGRPAYLACKAGDHRSTPGHRVNLWQATVCVLATALPFSSVQGARSPPLPTSPLGCARSKPVPRSALSPLRQSRRSA
jgi:hypothetical protein